MSRNTENEPKITEVKLLEKPVLFDVTELLSPSHHLYKKKRWKSRFYLMSRN